MELELLPLILEVVHSLRISKNNTVAFTYLVNTIENDWKPIFEFFQEFTKLC